MPRHRDRLQTIGHHLGRVAIRSRVRAAQVLLMRRCAKVGWGFRQNGRILWHKWMFYGISGIHKQHDMIFGCGLKKLGLGVLYATLAPGILWHEPSCRLEIDYISHLDKIDYTSSLDRLRPYLYSSEYLVTTASHNVPSFESKSLTLGLGATAPQHSLLWTRFGCPDARKSWKGMCFGSLHLKHRCRHDSTCYARLENAQVDWFKLSSWNKGTSRGTACWNIVYQSSTQDLSQISLYYPLSEDKTYTINSFTYIAWRDSVKT